MPRISSLRLYLYIAGDSPNSVASVRQLRGVLQRHPELGASLEIVDVLRQPELGLRHRVLVTPTLIRVAPAPERRIIGNLRDLDALHAFLGLVDAHHA